MSHSTSSATPSYEDAAVLRWAPWLTGRRMVFFVMGWLALFVLVSITISSPFQSEVSASSGPDYAHVMFLHGLLVGMVGLMALLACQVLGLHSMHVRSWIIVGVLVATVCAAIGGVWDKKIPGYEFPMWTQIIGFFALDEILLSLLIGLGGEWRRRRDARTVVFVAAILAAASMFLAAVMGHLAGYLLEFGWNTPGFLASFGKFAGFATSSDFAGALTGSHSHQMAVAAMALIAVLLAQQFGFASVKGAANVVSRVGMLMISAGIVVMTGMYMTSAFSSWTPPPWFVSGANGVASDDVITGILVMGGGVVLGLALLIGRFGTGESALARPTALAALWSWILSFATAVIAGYAIEMNTTYFGAGDPKAAGAKNDALFTWMHQDIGLFLLPALVLIMLVVERLLRNGRRNMVAWTTMVGTTIVFVGGMIWVFVDPALHGPGYLVTSVGLSLVGVALLATLWWGTISSFPEIQRPRVVRFIPGVH
jgi:hypothetical protein